MLPDPPPRVYPLYLVPVSAGFPSPAEDHIERRLDLLEHVIHRPATTFFVRVVGDSMLDAGIRNGDLLVVDRSLPVVSGSVIIAALDGELTLKRVHKHNGKLLLASANPAYPPIEASAESDCRAWGVATFVIHRLCPPSR